MFGAVLAVALAVSGLTACRSNVGLAATIDGHRVSESDVTSYLTRNAQAIDRTDAKQRSYQASPRSYVVEILINEALLRAAYRVLNATPNDRALDKLFKEQYKQSPRAFGESQDIRGYSSKFYRLLSHLAAMNGSLTQAVQRGVVDANRLFAQLRKSFKVTVNPRFGVWDAQELMFSEDEKLGAPSFIKPVSGDSIASPTAAATPPSSAAPR